MRLHLNKKPRKWLTLLFAISFLVNVQAAYACAMMPDMSGMEVECCCGISHKSTITENSTASPESKDFSRSQLDQSQICKEPRKDCCVIEVSVSVSDPPTSDEALILGSAKAEQHKIFKQLDNNPPVFEIVSFETQVANTVNGVSATLPDPFLHQHSPPLYKTTERYRI